MKSWKHTFFLSLCGSGTMALLALLITSFMSDERAGYVFLSFFVFFWSICAYSAFQKMPLRNLAAMCAGTTWGFHIVAWVCTELQNYKLNENFREMDLKVIATPLVLSIGFFLTVLPVRLVGARLLKPLWLTVVACCLLALVTAATFHLLPFTCRTIGPPGEYDLAAVQAALVPKRVRVGTEVQFEFRAINFGPDVVGEGICDVELRVNGKLISFDRGMPAMGQLQRQTIRKRWKPSRPGHYTYEFTVDAYNRVEETDETDNTITGSFEVIE